MFVIARTLGPSVHAHVLGGSSPGELEQPDAPSGAQETSTEPVETSTIQPDT